ncbi:MAG: hypothetical protein ACRDOH_33180 [Streptosporangiaceae bacterium]
MDLGTQLAIMTRVMQPYYEACATAADSGRRPPFFDPDGVYADEVRPGDCVLNPDAGWNGDDREVLDVTGVTGPDGEGMILIHAPGGPPVRVAADWGLERHTAGAADTQASLIMDEMER